jgi:SAM-dependent methyltransferase
MAGDDYVLSHTADAFERERLGHMESLVDLPTHRYLATLGIRQGWRCLEIGAGHGAVARWLAEQVGPQGRVVATDVDTRLLTDLTLPNVEVRQHDIRTDPLESGTYDLAHCRTLLMHMLEPHIVVRRMVAALRIGGWLLVEEPDFSSLRAVDAEHPLAEFFNRKDREISERVMAHSSGYNAYFGSRLRGLLEEAGLADIGNEGRTMIARGGELHARMRCMALQAFVERGLLSQAEYAELERVYSDPSFSYIMPTMFAAWGRRAS